MIWFLHKSVHEVIIVLFYINRVSTENITWVEIRKEFKTSSIISVHICIADLSIKRCITDKKMNAVNVFSCLWLFFLFSVVFLIIFLECFIECWTDIHYFTNNSHIFFMFIFITIIVPLLKSYFRFIFFTFFDVPIIFESNFPFFAFFLAASAGATSRSHSFGSWECIQLEIYKKKV